MTIQPKAVGLPWVDLDAVFPPSQWSPKSYKPFKNKTNRHADEGRHSGKQIELLTSGID